MGQHLQQNQVLVGILIWFTCIGGGAYLIRRAMLKSTAAAGEALSAAATARSAGAALLDVMSQNAAKEADLASARAAEAERLARAMVEAEGIVKAEASVQLQYEVLHIERQARRIFEMLPPQGKLPDQQRMGEYDLDQRLQAIVQRTQRQLAGKGLPYDFPELRALAAKYAEEI